MVDPYRIDVTQQELVEITERNLLEQYDALEGFFSTWQKSGKPFELTEQLILELNRIAVKGLRRDAGQYRVYDIGIDNSVHQPPSPDKVPELVAKLCHYVNERQNGDPFHLAAYVMWGINWVHPFGDGNGRTARALSYLVLCIGLGFYLPGTNIIPAQIEQNRSDYYQCLDVADEQCMKGILDVRQMELLLQQMLRRQLADI